MAKSKHYYTPEEDDWLRANVTKHSYAELARLLNARFGAGVNAGSVSDRCTKQLKIRRGANTGRFTQERVACDGAVSALPVGAETVYQGYTWIKLRHTYTPGKKTNAQFKLDWMEKQRYVYETEVGAIPDGWIVIFLDRDKGNFDPKNLYAVPRSIHARMCQNDWYTDNAEHTLTAIRLCELNERLKEASWNINKLEEMFER